jgi:hypothetical protein
MTQGQADEAHKLALLGRLLVKIPLPDVVARLPRELAEAAVAAWERDGLTSRRRRLSNASRGIEPGRSRLSARRSRRTAVPTATK